MNEIIKVTTNENNEQLVSGRELHEFLEVGTQYTKWIDRMVEYGFVEAIDFLTISQKRLTAQGNTTAYIDHVMKLDMAKEISMIQRTEKGKQARQYFIQVEKEYKQKQLDTSSLSPELQFMNSVVNQLASQELATKQLETKIDSVSEIVSLNTLDWRKNTNSLVNQVVRVQGGGEAHRTVRNEIYKEVERRAGANLSQRVTNKRRRMADEGVCKSKRDKLNQVDAIADDKKLVEIYLSVVKDFAIKYKVWNDNF